MGVWQLRQGSWAETLASFCLKPHARMHTHWNEERFHCGDNVSGEVLVFDPVAHGPDTDTDKQDRPHARTKT